MAIDKVVSAQKPLFVGDENKQRTAALILAVNYREGSLRPDIKGDKDKAGNYTSFCSMQVNLPNGAKTAEGWTGEDLVADVEKCITAGFRMLRESVRMCPKHPVAFYAEGRDVRSCSSKRAQWISNDRMFIATKLLKEVQWPEEYAFAQPPLWPVSSRVYAPRLFW